MVDEDNDWEERDIEKDSLEEDDEEEEPSIGNTELARGKARERWGQMSLEDEIEDARFEEDFSGDFEEDEEDFLEEDFEEEDGDFYSANGGRDFYGVDSGSGLGDIYGAPGRGNSGSSLYGAPGQDSVTMYNAPGQEGESSLYAVQTGQKKVRGETYRVEGRRKRRARGSVHSDLEKGVSVGRKRASRVSLS